MTFGSIRISKQDYNIPINNGLIMCRPRRGLLDIITDSVPRAYARGYEYIARCAGYSYVIILTAWNQVKLSSPRRGRYFY